ncbi:membrane-spanning 4-domains subfamily A member 4A-like [Brachyhypopomus gauderio]|uniref:membrane-spanning 4-domains subfamily A member 4A-like n=1 Tax=Brachyhypopomus gauderio TaxID=698409 RepID=UPI004041247E
MSSGAVSASNVGSSFPAFNHGSPTHVSPAVAQQHGATSAPPILTLGIPIVVPGGNVGNLGYVSNVGNMVNMGNVGNAGNLGNMGNVGAQPGQFEKFLKVQPKALGIVQIMIGITTILFGIVTTFYAEAVSVISGSVYWCSVIYIIAGSLTVAAENKRHICLLKGSLGMNVVSAVFSAPAIILLSTDFVVQQDYNCYESYGGCWMFISRSNGISGVLLLFSLLQLIISICISAFGCRATCCDESTVPAVMVSSAYGGYCAMYSPYPAHNSQQVFSIPNPQTDINHMPTEHPPAYTGSVPKAQSCD